MLYDGEMEVSNYTLGPTRESNRRNSKQDVHFYLLVNVASSWTGSVQCAGGGGRGGGGGDSADHPDMALAVLVIEIGDSARERPGIPRLGKGIRAMIFVSRRRI